MQSILGILYAVLLLNAKFLHLSLMQWFLGILYALFLLNAKFLHLVHAEFLFMNNTACKI